MRQPGGYAGWTSPDGPPVERDTFTCKHCNAVVHVEPRQAASEAGGWCGRCAAPICNGCAASGRCEPFERQIEAAEARDRLMRALV